MTECSFCAIASGTSEALIVHQSDTLVAFLDHRPLFPGHVLVVPRHHHTTIEDLPNELIEPLFGVVRCLAAAVRAAVDAPGTFIAMNNVISQSVPHLHVHVVPRRPGDGLRGFFWPRTEYEDPRHAAGSAATDHRGAGRTNGTGPGDAGLTPHERTRRWR